MKPIFISVDGEGRYEVIAWVANSTYVFALYQYRKGIGAARLAQIEVVE
jgi:hypothetical protein